MTEVEGDLVHVLFPLEVDENGWPPVSAEHVWARPVGPDQYQLENVPWFVRGVAEGDVVRAVPAKDDEWPTFAELVRSSGNCTIRVIPFKSGPLTGEQGAVLDRFSRFGVTGEGAGTYPIVALTIEPHRDLRAVKDLLKGGTQAGWWEFEEGCVTAVWLEL